jgi:hypothetical protein
MTTRHPTPRHPTPGPKMPEHLSTSKPSKTKEEKIDRQMEDPFRPAIRPPSRVEITLWGRRPIAAPARNIDPEGQLLTASSTPDSVKICGRITGLSAPGAK